jgi:hypothetical protein
MACAVVHPLKKDGWAEKIFCFIFETTKPTLGE